MNIRDQKKENVWRTKIRKKRVSKPSSSSKVRHPNALLYGFAYAIAYPMLKLLFRLDDGRRDFAVPDGPFVVVSNHSTMLDFLFAMLPFYPRRINAVTTSRYFFSPALGRLLPIMGCIPKNQFDPDVSSIKRVKTVLNRGGSILLFPEGRCSTDGAFAGIHAATGKLVKNLGVPVISCYIDGAYTCLPHWRKGIRLGRVRVTMSELFSVEDTREMSVEMLNAAMCARLRGEDGSRPGKPVKTFTARRLAEGLEKILYWCPSCDHKLSMVSKGNVLRCTACGNAAVLDKTGRLSPMSGSIVPESIHSWYSEQARHILEWLDEDMEPLRISVSVHVTNSNRNDGEVQTGSGYLSVDPTGFTYEGHLGGKSIGKFFPVESVPALPFEYDDNFQIVSGGFIYRFIPDDVRLSAMYSLLGEVAHRKFSSKVVLVGLGQEDSAEHAEQRDDSCAL